MGNEYSSSDNNGECKESQRCRRVAGQRREDPNRCTEQSGSTSTMLSSIIFLLGLASLASTTSPIAAASLHTPDRRSGFIARRKRRGSGERKTRRVKTEDLNNNTLDKRNRSGSKFFNSLTRNLVITPLIFLRIEKNRKLSRLKIMIPHHLYQGS